MKLAIAYRIYPKVSKETPVFNDNKLKLSEMCLSSFAKTLKNLDYRFWAILDGCPPEYEAMFRKHIPNGNLEIINTNAIGNAGTFGKQIEILTKQNFSDNIFFAEDDYFYLNKPFENFVEVLESGKYDFLSPYDHLDYYQLKMHDYPSVKKTVKNIELKNVSSTTMTLLTTKKAFAETRKVFETYLRNNYDFTLWSVLTRLKLYNPLTFLNGGSGFVPGMKYIAKMIMFTPKEYFFGKKYKLGVPVPSLAVHMDVHKLSPGIDWYALFEKESRELNIWE